MGKRDMGMGEGPVGHKGTRGWVIWGWEEECGEGDMGRGEGTSWGGGGHGMEEGRGEHGGNMGMGERGGEHEDMEFRGGEGEHGDAGYGEGG
jgi:hypothetical protein